MGIKKVRKTRYLRSLRFFMGSRKITINLSEKAFEILDSYCKNFQSNRSAVIRKLIKQSKELGEFKPIKRTTADQLKESFIRVFLQEN